MILFNVNEFVKKNPTLLEFVEINDNFVYR